MEPLDEDTWAWIDGVLGSPRVVSHFVHAHAQARLWRLESRSGYAWLKLHLSPHKHAAEVHALTAWADPLMPQVLGWRVAPPTLLLAECPGVDAGVLPLVGPAEERLWSQAGAWLRRFHGRTNAWFGQLQIDGSPQGESSHDGAAFLLCRFENRLRQARDLALLDAAELAAIEAARDAGVPAVTGARARSLHRDFSPRNWRAHPDGTLAAVIDFEHACWDLRAIDLTRPWDEDFRRNPRLVDAFFDAYGRPDERLAAQLETCRLYTYLAGVVWATRVGDIEYARRNHAALRELLA